MIGSLIEMSLSQKKRGKIVMCFGKVRVDLQLLLVMERGLGGVSFRDQNIRNVVMEP